MKRVWRLPACFGRSFADNIGRPEYRQLWRVEPNPPRLIAIIDWGKNPMASSFIVALLSRALVVSWMGFVISQRS